MRKTKAWAVIAQHGSVHLATVQWKRTNAIKAYVAMWTPMRQVPEWEERTVAWRWQWLKRKHGCIAERIVIIPEKDAHENSVL